MIRILRYIDAGIPSLSTTNYVKCKYVPFSKQYEACDVGKEKKRSPRSRSLVPPDNKSLTKAFVYTNETCLFDNFNSILKASVLFLYALHSGQT